MNDINYENGHSSSDDILQILKKLLLQPSDVISKAYCNEAILPPYNYIVGLPGKAIRIKLTEAFNHWLAIPASKLEAIADITQMLHNSSLLIDDIQDRSHLRRGCPVAHSIFGVAKTINSANYIYFLALSNVIQLGHPEAVNIYTEQLLELHRGQGLEIYWRDSLHCPTHIEYAEMVIKKTGGLFGLAVRLMLIFCENSFKGKFKSLTELLKILGLYFQIRDDYLNLQLEDSPVSSKDVGKLNKVFAEDITEGKYSFPIIHAIKCESNLSAQVSNIINQRPIEFSVKVHCIKIMQQLGSFTYTLHILDGLRHKAECIIKNDLGGNDLLGHLLSCLHKELQL